MDDAPLVRRVERLGDLFRHAQGLSERQRAAAQPALERLAADVLHGDAGTTVEGGDLVDGADERMIERGGGARLAKELLQAVALAGRGDELEGDLPMEHHVIGETDLPHASAADDLDDPIAGSGRRRGRHVMILPEPARQRRRLRRPRL